MNSTDGTNSEPLRVPLSQLGQVPTRDQVNAWMAEVGWQNSAIRQADLDKVERVVRAAVAAERERLIAKAAMLGWAMRDESPFEDAVRELCQMKA